MNSKFKKYLTEIGNRLEYGENIIDFEKSIHPFTWASLVVDIHDVAGVKEK